MKIFRAKIETNSAVRWLILLVIALASGCASVPQQPKSVVIHHRPAVVSYALSLQGIPYRYGKESPHEGFDCSGFVKHVYEHHGVALPRTAKEMAQTLPKIPKSYIQPGDLLFFNTNGRPFSHVGIYVDHDDFVHAPSRRTGKVLVSNLNNRYWRKHFTGVRRPQP